MKLNFKNILAAAALSALFVSCDRTAEFEPGQFVSLDHYSYSVNETAGEVVIPVHVYNATSEVQVAVSVISSTAEEGTGDAGADLEDRRAEPPRRHRAAR